jgi:hypothetical protein
MGREANCTCEWNGTDAQVKALLEPPELILRREIRRKLPFARMKRVAVEGAALRFTFDGEKVCLQLGATTAAKWAQIILTPPATLSAKLDVQTGSTVRMIGAIDDDTLRGALSGARLTVRGKADLIVARVKAPPELRSAFKKSAELLRNGVPIWLIYEKGPGHRIGEADVRSAGLAAGVVDVKVAAVSETLTGLKFVKRKS